MQILANSGPFQINSLDIKSIGRSAFDALIALVLSAIPVLAGATYVVAHHNVTSYVVLGLVLAVKAIRKWATNNNVELPPPGPLGSAQ